MPLEELDPDLRLEPRDCLRQRGLGQLEALRRASHLALVGHDHEVAQLPEVELAQLPGSDVRA
jgi:hypothetical protein